MRYLQVMLTAALIAVVCACCGQAALAQAALPTAPAADRASQGGLTAAAASLPGENGSPLEPYLVTWLLPVSGILTALVLVSVDKNVRARYR